MQLNSSQENLQLPQITSSKSRQQMHISHSFIDPLSFSPSKPILSTGSSASRMKTERFKFLDCELKNYDGSASPNKSILKPVVDLNVTQPLKKVTFDNETIQKSFSEESKNQTH